MITKIRFVRDQKGNPTLELTSGSIIEVLPLYLSEAAYTEWVPDTNGPGFPGENLKDGIGYDKQTIPNLKG